METTKSQGVGELLRGWRLRRRQSQLDLSLETEISARHLSFVETGRAKPSRELLLRLSEHLEIPLRERNALLLAAGYAPMYRETPLEAEAMAPVRDALDRLLAGHLPCPAIAVDLRWKLLAANQAALSLMQDGIAPELLQGAPNALRLMLHPRGLAPFVENFAEYSGHLLARLQRQAALSGDEYLAKLYREVREYPKVNPGTTVLEPAARVFAPLVLRAPGGEPWTFFSTISTFGTALDITLSEMAIESFFPGDAQTAEALRAGRVRLTRPRE